MPSAQDCAERLREQAYRTLLPQIRDLEQELQKINNSLSAGVSQIGRKLESLSRIELPTTELVLNEILGDVKRDRDVKASALALFAQSVRRKETQEEILALLLESSQKYYRHTALFAVRGDNYVGWSSRGFSDTMARRVGQCSFPRAESPKFEAVLEEGNPVIESGFAEGDPLNFVSLEAQGSYCLLPLKVLDRPVAILFAEGAEREPANADELSILAEFTVLRLENIALKILYELRAAAPEKEPTAREEPAAVEESAPVAETFAAAPESKWVAPEPEPAAEPVSEPAAETFAEPIPEPSRFDSGPVPEPVFRDETPSFTASEAASFESAEPVSQEEVLEPAAEPERLKMQAQEASAASAAAPALSQSRQMPEEEKLHTDAKRFARLLVSEIKLYNEHHVVEGRENCDLYLRLKRDIDRSREMYEKRVSPTVSRRIDYFHDEVIRILGDNDPSTLGSDYPGPRVES